MQLTVQSPTRAGRSHRWAGGWRAKHREGCGVEMAKMFELLCGEAVTPGCGQGTRWKLERDGVHSVGGAISGGGAAPLSL